MNQPAYLCEESFRSSGDGAILVRRIFAADRFDFCAPEVRCGCWGPDGYHQLDAVRCLVGKGLPQRIWWQEVQSDLTFQEPSDLAVRGKNDGVGLDGGQIKIKDFFEFLLDE